MDVDTQFTYDGQDHPIVFWDEDEEGPGEGGGVWGGKSPGDADELAEKKPAEKSAKKKPAKKMPAKKSPIKEWAKEKIKKLESQEEKKTPAKKKPAKKKPAKKMPAKIMADISIMAEKDYQNEGDFMYALQMKTKALENDYDVTAGAFFAISIDLRCKQNEVPPLDLRDYCEEHGDVCPNDADYFSFMHNEPLGKVFFELLRPEARSHECVCVAGDKRATHRASTCPRCTERVIVMVVYHVCG